MRRSDQDWKKSLAEAHDIVILFQVQDWPLQLLRLFSSMWPCSCLITLQYTDGALVGKPVRCLHAASPLYSSASASAPNASFHASFPFHYPLRINTIDPRCLRND
jgi:hypothetical protein